MKSLDSGIRLAASASIFHIVIQLTFIEQLYLLGNELSASTYAILWTVVKALKRSNIMVIVKIRKVSGGLKVSGGAMVGDWRFSIISWLVRLG